MQTHMLEITPTGRYTSKGERYEVRYNGELLAANHSPEFGACRILVDRGLTGKAAFYRPDKAPHLTMSIAWGAKHIVSETQRSGVRFAKYVPVDLSKMDEDEREAA